MHPSHTRVEGPPAPDDTHQPSRVNRRLRCAHYISHIRLSTGGPVRVVMDLCATLAQRGHHVTLFTCDPADAPPGWLAGEPFTPHVITLEKLGRFTKLLPRRSLARVAADLPGHDVLHLHGPWETANLQFARISRRVNIPYIVAVHGTLDDWSMAQQTLKKKTYLRIAARRFLERAAAVQCTADAELEQASRHLGAARGVVLPPIVDLSGFEALPGTGPARAAFPDIVTDVPKVLFLSRIHPVKGLEILIDAAALLRSRGLPVRVLIAGSGDPVYEGLLRERVTQHRLDESVKFLGLVRGVEKTSLYQAADVFVHPSSQENFGLVLPEAMACGTPVVTTRGVGIWRDIQAAGGLIVDRTALAIADAISQVTGDAMLHAEMSRRGRAWVFETLGPDRLLARYEALYTEAAGIDNTTIA